MISPLTSLIWHQRFCGTNWFAVWQMFTITWCPGVQTRTINDSILEIKWLINISKVYLLHYRSSETIQVVNVKYHENRSTLLVTGRSPVEHKSKLLTHLFLFSYIYWTILSQQDLSFIIILLRHKKVLTCKMQYWISVASKPSKRCKNNRI